MKKFNKIDKRLDIIQAMVEKNELSIEANVKELVKMFDKEELLIDSSALGLGDKIDMIFYENKGMFNEERIAEKIINSIFFDEYKKFEIIIFVHTIEERIKAEESVSAIIGAYFKKNKKSRKIWEISTQFVGTEETLNLGISVDSTLSILEYNHLEPNAEGQVYNAKLYDIVKVYNCIGDYLFKDNVRKKIENVLEVDVEIEKTLDESPEKFWFLNNGITLMVDNERLVQRREYQIDVNLDYNADVSIINGAQTVSVAAKYYFKLKNMLEKTPQDKELKEKLENAMEAKVLLRIIKKDVSRNNMEFYKDISVALNRQKAINDADIRYTDYLVEDINNISEGKEAPFFIVDKREERTQKKFPRHYSIERFVKISAIYLLQEPGSARAAKGKYIKHDIHWSRLNISDKEEISEELFLKKYKPFIIVDRIFDRVSKKMNEMEKRITDIKRKNVLKYGSEFLCAYIAWVANKRNSDNFVHFPNRYVYDETLMSFLVEEFTELTCQCFMYDEIESNLFKKDKKYIELRNWLDKYGILDSFIYSLFSVEE